MHAGREVASLSQLKRLQIFKQAHTVISIRGSTHLGSGLMGETQVLVDLVW